MIKTLIKLYFLVALSTSVVAQDKNEYALLSASELEELLSTEKDLTVLDLRESGKYKEGHIKGAINVDRREFVDSSLDYGGMKSSKEDTEELMSKYGIASGSHIILYDDDSGYDAARLWFIIKSYGHEKVQLLDGGFKKWELGQLPVSKEVVSISPSKFSFPVSSDSEYLATFSEINQSLGSKDVIILDVRSDREYSSGHIPGAVNVNWVENLDGQDFFKARDELLKQFTEAGITPDKEIVTYCRSGVRASHTGYVLREILGFNNVKIYDGSWIEWTHKKGEIEK